MSSADAPSAAVRTMTPPVGGDDLLEDVLQPLALPVLEPARDAEPFAVRDVDEEPPGQRDLGRQPRALRLHRILHRLDEDLLPALDQVGDLLAVPLALELGDDDLVDVEEPVLLEADLDERRLHPGEHVVDRAEVDVPRDRPPLGALEVDLGDLVVLEQGDALLADVDRDQQLALRRGSGARRGRAGGPCAALPPPRLSPLAVLLLRRLGRRPSASRWPLGRPSPDFSPPPSAAAPGFFRPRPPRLPRRRRFAGRVSLGVAACLLASVSRRRPQPGRGVPPPEQSRPVRRRLVVFASSKSEPGQESFSSCQRARAQPRRGGAPRAA